MSGDKVWVYKYRTTRNATVCQIYGWSNTTNACAVSIDISILGSCLPIIVTDESKFAAIKDNFGARCIHTFDGIFTALCDLDPFELLHGKPRSGCCYLVQFPSYALDVIENHFLENERAYGCSLVARRRSIDLLHYLIAEKFHGRNSYGWMTTTFNWEPLQLSQRTALKNQIIREKINYVDFVAGITRLDANPPSIPCISYDIEVINPIMNEFPTTFTTDNTIAIISCACFDFNFSILKEENIRVESFVVLDNTDDGVEAWKPNKKLKGHRRWFFKTERELLEAFMDFLQRAVFVTGWFIHAFDSVFLTDRLTDHFGFSFYQNFSECGMRMNDISGHVGYVAKNINFLHFDHQEEIDGFFLKSKYLLNIKTSDSLNDVASILGYGTKIPIKISDMNRDFTAKWNGESVSINVYIDYCEQDSMLAAYIAAESLDLAIEIAFEANTNPQTINSTFARTKFLASTLMRESFQYREPIAQKYFHQKSLTSEFDRTLWSAKAHEKYQGALVQLPDNGGCYYGTVVNFDVASMYPSILLEYNLTDQSMFTFPSEEYIESLEWFDDDMKEKFHFFEIENQIIASLKESITTKPSVLVQFINRKLKERKEIKIAMKTTADDVSKRRFNARQNVLKIQVNSLYGNLGMVPYTGNFLSHLPAASTITALGRNIISKLMKYIESRQFTIIYCDTDGVFLYSKESLSKWYIDEILQDINRAVLQNGKISLACEDVGDFFFGLKKKRYIFRLRNGQFKLNGLKKMDAQLKTTITELIKSSINTVINYIKTPFIWHNSDEASKQSHRVHPDLINYLKQFVAETFTSFEKNRLFVKVKPMKEYKNPTYLSIHTDFQYAYHINEARVSNEVEYVHLVYETGHTQKTIMLKESIGAMECYYNIIPLIKNCAHLDDICRFFLNTPIEKIILKIQHSLIDPIKSLVNEQIGDNLISTKIDRTSEICNWYTYFMKRKVVFDCRASMPGFTELRDWYGFLHTSNINHKLCQRIDVKLENTYIDFTRPCISIGKSKFILATLLLDTASLFFIDTQDVSDVTIMAALCESLGHQLTLQELRQLENAPLCVLETQVGYFVFQFGKLNSYSMYSIECKKKLNL